MTRNPGQSKRSVSDIVRLMMMPFLIIANVIYAAFIFLLMFGPAIAVVYFIYKGIRWMLGV